VNLPLVALKLGEPCRALVVESHYRKYSFNKDTVSCLQEPVPVGEEDSLSDRSALAFKSTSRFIPALLFGATHSTLTEYGGL